MKNLKKLTALALIGAMVLSLAGCGEKKITGKEFKKILKDEDFEVIEGDDDDYEENYTAISEDGDVIIQYYLFEDKDDAKDDFEDGYEDLKDAKDDDEFEGTLKKSGNRSTVKGEFDDNKMYGDSELYMVCIRVDEMMIVALTADTSKSAVKDVDEALKALGY